MSSWCKRRHGLLQWLAAAIVLFLILPLESYSFLVDVQRRWRWRHQQLTALQKWCQYGCRSEDTTTASSLLASSNSDNEGSFKKDSKTGASLSRRRPRPTRRSVTVAVDKSDAKGQARTIKPSTISSKPTSAASKIWIPSGSSQSPQTMPTLSHQQRLDILKRTSTELQACLSPADILNLVDRRLSMPYNVNATTTGTTFAASFYEEKEAVVRLMSLILIRLSKHCICWYNQQTAATASTAPLELATSATAATCWFGHAAEQQSFRRIVAMVIERLATASTMVLSKCTDSSTHIVLDALVEGTKALAILARLENGSNGLKDTDDRILPAASVQVLWDCWQDIFHAEDAAVANDTAARTTRRAIHYLDESQISGIKWAWDTFQVSYSDDSIPPHGNPTVVPPPPRGLVDAYEALNLPFCIVPGGLLRQNGKETADINDCLSSTRLLSTLRDEVDFAVDDIRTTASGHVIPERRWTAWQGDANVGPFLYSGKSMPRQDWSDTVLAIRNAIDQSAHGGKIGYNVGLDCFYFDACLLNLYPDGASAMRYHSDPDQGTLWDYDTAVVSIGATRRFAFRPIALPHETTTTAATTTAAAVSATASGIITKVACRPHSFVVFHSDVAYMFADCQDRFQHTIKNADDKQETSPRISLVFKRTFGLLGKNETRTTTTMADSSSVPHS